MSDLENDHRARTETDGGRPPLDPTARGASLDQVLQVSSSLMAAMNSVIEGKEKVVRTAVTVLLAEGHLLVEDVPGVGKTLLAKALARSIDCSVRRVQFTPDLLPSDITGVSVFNQDVRDFEFRPGAIFANVVVGDEINRASPKTQSALLESMEERLEHLLRLRELQDETGGFTAFITWSYQPEHTERGGYEATGIEYLRTLAVSRLVLDNFDSIQASWVTQGGKVGQLSLAFGANDMGSVMIEENVVRAAGASYCLDEVEIVRNVEDAGFVAKRRNMHYDILGDPIFRLREIPRMLELATARKDGDHSVPVELVNYPARSAAGKRLRDPGATSSTQ